MEIVYDKTHWDRLPPSSVWWWKNDFALIAYHNSELKYQQHKQQQQATNMKRSILFGVTVALCLASAFADKIVDDKITAKIAEFNDFKATFEDIIKNDQDFSFGEIDNVSILKNLIGGQQNRYDILNFFLGKYRSTSL